MLGLGILALATGPLLGGIVPASLALLLASQARAEMLSADGYLLGGRTLRIGVRLAWIGITLAAVALTVAIIAGLLTLAQPAGGHDYDPTVN